MHQTPDVFHLLKNLVNSSLLLFILSSNVAAAAPEEDTGLILVTIKPLYSLVAHLTEGIESPVLLMKQAQSPHHYNMKPSERELLAKARMIIWLGPAMESFLSNIIQQQQSSATVVSGMQAKNLNLLGKRKKHAYGKDLSQSSQRPESHSIDPHIWLSTDNAIAVSHHITESLITYDPKNSELYIKNLQQLLVKIKQTDDFIKSTLNNRHRPFIVFHDAFQYFEHEYGLNYIGAITYDEEAGVSLKHIRQIKTDIENRNIQCLVYQQPKPAIVDSLTKQAAIKAFALDPLGLNVSDDKNAWFEIMQQMALGFNNCLSS